MLSAQWIYLIALLVLLVQSIRCLYLLCVNSHIALTLFHLFLSPVFVLHSKNEYEHIVDVHSERNFASFAFLNT